MRKRIKQAFENSAAAPIAFAAVLVFGYQILPKIDPEIQAPTQGILADMWRVLRNGDRPSVDVSDTLDAHIPPRLFLDVTPLWVADELIGTERRRTRNADLDCPLAGWARRTVQCDVTIGQDPCLYRVRLVFESETDHGPVTRVTATAKRCRADG